MVAYSVLQASFSFMQQFRNLTVQAVRIKATGILLPPLFGFRTFFPFYF